MFTYTFYHSGRRHTLLPMAETPRQREALEGWRRVTPFLTRFIVHEALRDDPVGFKAFVMRTLCLHTGLDHSSPEHAWEAYLDSETALLDLTLAKRRDGLGPSLRPGAITQLYEARDRQLLEHLHNLSFSGDAGDSHTR